MAKTLQDFGFLSQLFFQKTVGPRQASGLNLSGCLVAALCLPHSSHWEEQLWVGVGSEDS